MQLEGVGGALAGPPMVGEIECGNHALEAPPPFFKNSVKIVL